jgi:hypothetical protein
MRMRNFLYYLLFLVLFFFAITCYGQMTKNQFYDSLNTIREKSFLPPLKRSLYLEIKSENWLSFLYRHDLGLVHDNTTHDGEVLTNADDYLTAWIKSPSHRRIILGRKWKRIGIGYKNGVVCARLN